MNEVEKNKIWWLRVFLYGILIICIFGLVIVLFIAGFTKPPIPNNWNNLTIDMDIKNATKFIGTPEYMSEFCYNKTKQTRYGWYLTEITFLFYFVDVNKNNKIIKIMGPLRDVPKLSNAFITIK